MVQSAAVAAVAVAPGEAALHWEGDGMSVSIQFYRLKTDSLRSLELSVSLIGVQMQLEPEKDSFLQKIPLQEVNLKAF